MKAVVFNQFGGAEVLKVADIEPPSDLDRYKILVRVKAAALNPKDTFIRKGYFKELTGSRFPMQTGFDFAGEVVRTGERVQGVECGMPVYGMLNGWEGRTCAQYVIVKSNQLNHKPQKLTFEKAAALPLTTLTALQALRDEAHVRNLDRVCINGAAGGVGSMAVQIAKLFGAHVTAISSARNHEFLRGLGADECIDYHQTDISQSSSAFDIFFDVFGNQLFEKVRGTLSKNGVWVSTVLRREVAEAVEETKHATGKKAKLVIVKPSHEDLGIVARWVETGRLKPIIQEVYEMDRISEAHLQQESKHTRGKLVVQIPS